jgi:hypothetical protein
MAAEFFFSSAISTFYGLRFSCRAFRRARTVPRGTILANIDSVRQAIFVSRIRFVLIAVVAECGIGSASDDVENAGTDGLFLTA